MRRYFIINHQDTATVSLVKSSQQTTSFTALLFFYDSEGKQGCMFGTKGQRQVFTQVSGVFLAENCVFLC